MTKSYTQSYTREYFSKKIVDKYAGTFTTEANKVIHEIELSIINKIIKDNDLRGNYLDVACGFGRITMPISKHFKKTDAVDSSPHMIKLIKKDCMNYSIRISKMNAEELKFNSNQFDLITAMRFIMSFNKEERIEILKEIKRVLKQEGIFICNVHLNKWSPRGILNQLTNKFRNSKQPYLSYFEIKKDLKKSGFKILDFYGVKIIPFYGRKLIINKEHIFKLESKLMKIAFLKHFADGHIFVCKRRS